MTVLEVTELAIAFGGVRAVRGVTLSASQGQIVGIIGPNGAGKTTVFNLITGFEHPDRGRVLIDGNDMTGASVQARVRAGLGRTLQNVGLVKTSTVLANLMIAQEQAAGYGRLAGMLGTPRAREREAEMRDLAEQTLVELGLHDVARRPVAHLPYGVQKLAELAAVLMTDPTILLLDEPTSGLGPSEAAEFGRTLLGITLRRGLTTVLIEHHVPLVVEVCDHVYCLAEGAILAEGPPLEVRHDDRVISAYLGSEA